LAPSPALIPLLLAAGCQLVSTTPVVVEKAGPGTVLGLSWETPNPRSARVDYGVGDLDQTIELAESATSQSVSLVGLPPESDASYRVTILDDGDTVAEVEGTYATPAPPRSFPTLTVEGDPQAEPLWVVTSLVGSKAGAVVVDTEGVVTWWHSVGGTASLTDAQLSADGTEIDYLRFASTGEDPSQLENTLGEIVTQPVLGGPPQRHDIHPGHHGFARKLDGSYLYPVYDFREVDGVWVRGDNVVQLAPDGTQTVLWSTWDSFTYDPEALIDGSGWTHANGLTWDEDEQVIYVSLRNLNCVVKLSAEGELLWKLGGPDSDFSFSGARGFDHQHRLRPLEDGHVLVFDNGPSANVGSRVVEFALDAEAGTATEVWSYSGGLFVYSLGDVWRLPSGNTLVSWGSSGRFELVDPAGVSLWSMSADIGGGFGFGEPLASLEGFGG
jgi:hypothetical protein